MITKIVVSGAYGDGNIGDDLLLFVIINEIKEISDYNRIIITGKKAKYLKKLFPGVKVVSKSRGKYINPDIFILGGGTQFFSFANVENKNKLLIYFKILLRDPIILLDIFKKIFINLKKPVKIALGIGLGPFASPVSEINTKKLLKKFDYIYCRDIMSYKYCNDWLINSTYVADICLSTNFKRIFPFEHKKTEDSRIKIGIVLRDWKYNSTGTIINNKIKEWVIENKSIYDIEFFIFSIDKDKGLIRDLEINFSNKINIWDPDNQSFDQYLNLFNTVDVVITSRYHAAIFAISFKIPTVCLGIDPKLKHLSNEVKGFHYWSSSSNKLDISEYIFKVINHYSEYQISIKESSLLLEERANLVFSDLERLIHNN